MLHLVISISLPLESFVFLILVDKILLPNCFAAQNKTLIKTSYAINLAWAVAFV